MTEQSERAAIMALILTLLIIIFLQCVDGQDTSHSRHHERDSKIVHGEGNSPARSEFLTSIINGVMDDQDSQDIAKRDTGLDGSNMHSCLADEYWSTRYQMCKLCTRCSPGTEHEPQSYCGNGRGTERDCKPCLGGFYQDREDFKILTCRPCLTCDPHAKILQPCSHRSNTVCGPCKQGWFAYHKNICFKCFSRMDHGDCHSLTTFRPGEMNSLPDTTFPSHQNDSFPNTTTSYRKGVHRNFSRWEVLLISVCIAIIALGFILLFALKKRFTTRNGPDYNKAPVKENGPVVRQDTCVPVDIPLRSMRPATANDYATRANERAEREPPPTIPGGHSPGMPIYINGPGADGSRWTPNECDESTPDTILSQPGQLTSDPSGGYIRRMEPFPFVGEEGAGDVTAEMDETEDEAYSSVTGPLTARQMY